MKADRKCGWAGNCRVNPENWTKSDQDRRREFSADCMLKGQNSSLRITSVSDNNSKKVLNNTNNKRKLLFIIY